MSYGLDGGSKVSGHGSIDSAAGVSLDLELVGKESFQGSKRTSSASRSDTQKRNHFSVDRTEEDEETSRRIVAGFSEISSRVDTERIKIKRGEIPKKTKENERLKREIEMDEHLIPIEDLILRLGTDIDRGLGSEEVRRRLRHRGHNRLTPVRETSRVVLFLKIMFGGLASVLWIAAILALIGYAIEEGTHAISGYSVSSNLLVGVILVVINVISGVFTFYQEERSRKTMEGFRKLVPQRAVALRDGFKMSIDACDLVIGDVVFITAGDKIPADVRVVHESGFKVDNSSLTGESEPQVRKIKCTHENPLETANIAFYSTNAIEGKLTGIVINTGDNTVIGRIAHLVNSRKKLPSPIELEIRNLMNILAIIALIAGSVFLGIGFALHDPWSSNITLFIGIVVGNIPESLLATITVSLTLAAKRMVRKNVLVKDLRALETLGRTSTICSDKTGTLTENQMRVSHIWLNGSIYDSFNFSTQVSNFELPRLFQVAILCNKSDFAPGQDSIDISRKDVIGDATEAGLLRFFARLISIHDYRKIFPKLLELPFNSSNKFQLSIHLNSDKKSHFLVMKGAPEKILAFSSTYMRDEQTYPIDEDFRASFDRACKDLACLGERVLGFCIQFLNEELYPVGYGFELEAPNFPMNEFCFVGLISLMDLPRESVPFAIEKCRDAGIRVIMVTGDHPSTAEAIARKIGIFHDEPTETAENRSVEQLEKNYGECLKPIVVHGEELRHHKDEDLDAILEHRQILFARTTPQQKLMIVEGVQRRHEVVAVTGDGVNDSPALKQANIGIAMGLVGSDVSKEVADIILLDDNFSSIVQGIEEGRLIFANLKKSIAYVLSSKLPEMLPFFAYLLFQIPVALSAILILCVDIGTDFLPSISLAYEKAELDIMKRPSRSLEDKLIAPRLLFYSYVQLGLLQALAGFVNYGIVWKVAGFTVQDLFYNSKIWSNKTELIARSQAAYFVGVVICRIAVLLVSKTHFISLFQQNFLNYVMLIGISSEICLVCVIVYIPQLNRIFGVSPLPWYSWLIPIPFALSIIVYDEIRKFILRHYPQSLFSRIFIF